jgi:hypothetical protein
VCKCMSMRMCVCGKGEGRVRKVTMNAFIQSIVDIL